MIDNKYKGGAKLLTPQQHKKIHQSRNFVGAGAAPYDWTQALTRNYTQPIKNQFMAGMCGGELLSQAMQIYRTLVLGLPFQELSEISVYSQSHLNPDGMDIAQLQEVAGFLGLTSFQNVPTPQNCTEEQAQNTSWENPAMMRDCLVRAGFDMVSVQINIDSIAQAIRDNYFVGFCLGVSSNGTWGSSDPQPPKPGQVIEGHFMCSTPNIPAAAPTKKVLFYQSWGENVGQNGMQYFDETYINSGYIYDAFTFVKHVFNQNLMIGMMGNEVKYLQVRLGIQSSTYGFGVFGPKTLAVVIAFQKANNITPTGFVGPLTRIALNK